ncbi:apolipoprotein N-acyltransferase [Nocardioides montaniterrae]
MTARLMLAALAGGLLAAAYEPIAIGYLLPLALAGFALVTRGCGIRTAAATGWVFGLAFSAIHLDWLARSIGVGAWLALSLALSLSYAAVAATVPILRRGRAWPLTLALVWIAMEDVRSTWPVGGMPWGRLSYAVIDTPFAPAVAYLGMSLTGACLAFLGFLIAHAIEQRRLRPTLLAVAAAAALLVPAVAPYPFHQQGTTDVAAIQGDVPGGDNMLADPRGITRNQLAGTRRLAHEIASGKRDLPAFVLWPENSSVVDVFYDPPVNAMINRAVHSIGVPIVVGGVAQDGDHHMLNQGIVWDPVTGAGDRYTKRHPVPWGEYVPFRSIWNPGFGRLALVPRDMEAGTRTTPLTVAGTRLGDAICFDVAYDEVLRDQVRNGAQLLAVQTSNATFINTAQVDQQFAITRLRAIETGRWVVVASTNGLSGIIDPHGEVVATAPRRTSAILQAYVGLSTATTPAMWLGPWPGRLIAVLALLALAVGALDYRRRRGEAQAVGGRMAVRRVPGDAAGRALRDHQGGQLDRPVANDRAAAAGLGDRDLADPS